MNNQDKTGRSYATKADTNRGDLVQVDGGFTCIDPWSLHYVHENQGRPYITCADGQHFLDGQLDASGKFYVGVYPIKLPEPTR